MPSPNEARLVANGREVLVEQLTDRLVDFATGLYRGGTIDELLLHPHEGLEFTTFVRRQTGFHDLPDNLILRLLLARRRNP